MTTTLPASNNEVLVFCRKTIHGTEQYSIWKHDELAWYAERQNHGVRRHIAFLAATIVATLLIAVSTAPSFLVPASIRAMFSFPSSFSWVGILAGIIAFFLVPILCYGRESIVVYRDASKRELVFAIIQQTRFKLLQDIQDIVDQHHSRKATLQRSVVFTQFARAWKCVTPQGQLLGAIKQRSDIDRIVGRPSKIEAPFVLYNAQEQVAGTFDYTLLDLQSNVNHTVEEQIALALSLIINAEYSSKIVDLTREEWLRLQESKALGSQI
jgi:hypothetical protein